MEIKLIAMDMDGTLLNKEDQILPETKQALIRLEEKGVRLVLASGRSFYKLMKYAKELKMDEYGGYLVEINGLAIYDLKKEQRNVKALMPIESYKELFRFFSNYKVEIVGTKDRSLIDYIPESIYEEKRMYREKHNLSKECPWTAGAFSFIQDHRIGYPDIRYITKEEEIKEEVNKVCITYEPEYLEMVIEEAKKYFKDKYWMGRTTPRWLEIMMPGINKGSAIQSIANDLGIKPEEIMCFGDGENDIDMFNITPYGIAMGNALETVKQKAFAVTDTNLENGIAKALDKYMES